MSSAAGLLRVDGRRRDQLRPVKVTRNFHQARRGVCPDRNGRHQSDLHGFD